MPRVEVGGVAQPYGLCDIGHQGLIHDKEFALIYVRARYLHAILMRMMSWDKEGYIEGMNLYEYCRSSPIGCVDPLGLASIQLSPADVDELIPDGLSEMRSPVFSRIPEGTSKKEYLVPAKGERKYDKLKTVAWEKSKEKICCRLRKNLAKLVKVLTNSDRKGKRRPGIRSKATQQMEFVLAALSDSSMGKYVRVVKDRNTNKKKAVTEGSYRDYFSDVNMFQNTSRSATNNFIKKYRGSREKGQAHYYIVHRYDWNVADWRYNDYTSLHGMTSSAQAKARALEKAENKSHGRAKAKREVMKMDEKQGSLYPGAFAPNNRGGKIHDMARLLVHEVTHSIYNMSAEAHPTYKTGNEWPRSAENRLKLALKWSTEESKAWRHIDAANLDRLIKVIANRGMENAFLLLVKEYQGDPRHCTDRGKSFALPKTVTNHVARIKSSRGKR